MIPSPTASPSKDINYVEGPPTLQPSKPEEDKSVKFDLHAELINEYDLDEWHSKLIENLNAADDGYAVLSKEDEEAIRKITVTQAKMMVDELADRNALLVDFVPVGTCVMRCNTAMYFLGSSGQCIAVFMYLVKYMTKEANQLSNLIPLISKARETVKKYPGIVRDGESKEIRDLKKFAARIINHSEGGMREISSTTVCYANLGGTLKLYILLNKTMY